MTTSYRRRSHARGGRSCRAAALVAAVLAGTGVREVTSFQAPVEFHFDAPAAMAPVAARLQQFDAARLTRVLRLTGPVEAMPPIRVRIAHAESEASRTTPPWIAGFAVAHENLIVLFPHRIGSYPHESLEQVFAHEVAHVLAGRAAGLQTIPRWFSEGLASAAERDGGLEHRTQLAWALISGDPLTPGQLDGLFLAGQREAIQGYALADALVRHLLDRQDPAVTARILQHMRAGASFDRALMRVTGGTPQDLFSDFWSRHVVWKRWVAIAGDPFTLWISITLLALVAIGRHRRRRIEQRRRWDLEEQTEIETWRDRGPHDTVH